MYMYIYILKTCLQNIPNISYFSWKRLFTS